MKRITLALTSFTALSLLTAGVAFADPNNCRPIYGGGQTCVQAENFTIDKRIQNPQNQQFVDNLGVNDLKFLPGSTINFAVTVNNTSDRTIENITIQDVFPKYLEFVSGQGKYDKATRTLSFSVAGLTANEEKTYIIKAKVVGAESFPDNQQAVCMANLARAEAGNANGADNSQFCVQVVTEEEQTPSPTPANGKQPAQPTPGQTKGGLPVMPEPKSTTSPSTGPEALSLLALIPSGIAGYLLRKAK